MAPNDKMNVVVTGCGLVSSLGLDVANCCAAGRAGILRTGRLDWFPVRDPEDGEIDGVVGHAVPFLTHGFEGDPRLMRLLQGGFGDLLVQTPDAPWTSRHTALYLSVPDCRRAYTGIDLIAHDENRQLLEAEAKQAENAPRDENWVKEICEKSARLAGWRGDLDVRFVASGGLSGFSETLGRALDDLRSKRTEIAIVGGVDSLLEEETLWWLERTGRLKPRLGPPGCSPGRGVRFYC